MLPKQPRFAKYIKGKKTKAQKDVELVAKYFEVSKKEAAQYYNFLTAADIKQMKTIYGIK